MDADTTVLDAHSPALDAWRRFRGNALAVGGLVIVLGMSVAVIAAPWLSGEDPTEQRPWLGATPPGSSHPDCRQENYFTVGHHAEAPPALCRARNVQITTETNDTHTYRITVRRGRIHRITRTLGAVPVDEFVVGGEGGHAFELLEGDVLGPPLAPMTLRAGDSPPATLFAPGKRVALVQRMGQLKTTVYDIALEDGVVKRIVRDNTALSKIRVDGPDVSRVIADGQECRRQHRLGTDAVGRDVLSRVLYGGRISILVGVVATSVSLLIGVLYGAISGYAGGRIDRVMMSVVDILYAIPFMFVVILLLVTFGRNIIMLFVALGAVQWLTTARIVRGQVLSLKRADFIDAARLSGASPLRIIRRHLLPNTMGPVVVYTTLTVPAVILEESFLAFIGLAVQLNGVESWGALIEDGMRAMGTDGGQAWLLLGPGCAMALTLFGLNCLGDGLRDCLDPKMQKSR